MAAVTQSARPNFNVNGVKREIYYPDITVVTTGDTLFVPIRNVQEMVTNNTSITAMATAVSGFGSSITFTGTGANLLFKVTGQ